MSEPDRDLILKALERVIDPELKRKFRRSPQPLALSPFVPTTGLP